MTTPNISAVLTAMDKITMKANVDANKAIIEVFGVNLTPEERRAQGKAGPDSISFIQNCLSVGKSHPATVPGDMSIGEFEKDVVLFADLNELTLHHNPYIEMISDTKLAVGFEAYRQALRIYATVKELAKNNSAFETIRQKLAERFAELRGPKQKTILQKVLMAAHSSISLQNVVAGAPFKNDGITDLMFCQGVLQNCQSGTTVAPGATFDIPEGVTSITVTNLGNAPGSFTVKVSGE